MALKRVMVLTGGGDCPGLNAVIRGIVKRASQDRDWEVVGCIESFNGVLREPTEVEVLDEKRVEGLQIQGGTILGTTNKGGPFQWPVRMPDGSWTTADRSDEMIRKLGYMGIDAVINIGGDGSQRISLGLAKKGLRIVGVPKTIDNDLSLTDYTFGFQTAVQICTEAIDKLVTTAASHNRVFIMEVMGRDAGWIALHSAIAGGADVCIIPEIPYDVNKIKEKIEQRYNKRRGYCIVVVAEGARAVGRDVTGVVTGEVGYQHIKLGGVGEQLADELKMAGVEHDIRCTILGHLQRGGTPIAFDRVLASEFGVRAMEFVMEGRFGQMVAYRHPDVVGIPLEEAVREQNLIKPETNNLIRTAKGLGIAFGD
ncbi:MAG: ATP-dependent 6-phosphofructokinase [Bacteroidales bacterium]|nr:ATP-dependent 6-phosphofructokinase [Candidatus Colimorpha onthohippi]